MCISIRDLHKKEHVKEETPEEVKVAGKSPQWHVEHVLKVQAENKSTSSTLLNPQTQTLIRQITHIKERRTWKVKQDHNLK